MPAQAGTANVCSQVAASVSSGPGWTFWAILLSVAVAVFAVAVNRVVMKRRAAIDLILRSETADFRKCKGGFNDLVNNGVLMNVYNPKSGEDYERRRQVQELFNHYELLAISIHQNIVDEDIVKRYQRGTLIQHWDDAKELITKVRGDSKTNKTYINYEWLVDRWNNDPEVRDGFWPGLRRIFKELLHF